ncbi:MAG TPA: SLC13 family permease [Gaiellaceae bacterium]
MAHHLQLAVSLACLLATLATAVAQPRWLPEAVAAAGGALVVLAVGAVSPAGAWHTVTGIAPTVGFLAALLLLADGCRREGLFAWVGAAMASGAAASPQRLLALVFVAASAVTISLGLDPTVVLLTPVVMATAARLRMSPRPHVYACSHLANSASLLLPISNLTNLLAFHESRVSFLRFGALMALPTLGVIGVEWIVLRGFFRRELHVPAEGEAEAAVLRTPRFALGVVAATLLAFLLAEPAGIAPLWVAAAGAAAILAPAIVRRRAPARGAIRAIEPSFLLFVVGLGVVVAAAGATGLGPAVRAVIPGGTSLADLLLVAAVGALLANLVNNLPAILILAPAAAAAGHVSVLAALIGVNVGPNLTYTGSLATLLWRRRLRAEHADVELGEFVRLGALTVPPALVVATALLWAGARLGL